MIVITYAVCVFSVEEIIWFFEVTQRCFQRLLLNYLQNCVELHDGIIKVLYNFFYFLEYLNRY